MNCKPGDLARIVGMPRQLTEANDRFVRLKSEPSFVNQWGDVAWYLTEPISVVLVANGRSAGQNFYIGESVWIYDIADKYLRPIRPDGITDEEVRDLYASNPLQIGQSLHEGALNP